MPLNRFLIGFTGQESGLQRNVRPWLIADNAFARCNNSYVFRGRVRKRFGSTLMGETQINSRLRINIGTTAAVTGNFAGNVPGVVFEVGQMFSIGDTIFTVNQAGSPANMLSTGAATGTYDTATGAVNITGNNENPNTIVYFYSAQPVMGITQYEQPPINNEPTFAFDTQFAYEFDESMDGLERLTGGTDTWTGTDSQFFWTANYQGATPNLNLLWVTNFNAPDGIRNWDGATWTTPVLQYANNAPGPNNIITCRIIVQFKNRLLFLNTIESVNGVNTPFVNRCRYSAVGSPLAANAWNQDVPGNGSAVDAPTQEAITTSEFLKDRLIVSFERSTWELVYTGNQIFPFVWQKINTELGAESTFSQVPFDKVVLGIGQVGINACNGANVERIDDKIPDEVWNFHNQNKGVERVAGIRDYFAEMVYWSYPGTSRSNAFPYPNKVLTYNYLTNAWGINDDSFTAFGYYQKGEDTPGVTWGDSTMNWSEANFVWNSAQNQVRMRTVVAGNQEGWVVIINTDVSRNAPALQITDVVGTTLTIINHNLSIEDFILLENVNGITLGNDIVAIDQIVDENTIVIDTTVAGVYTGGGTVARVSRIDILTKQYNFFVNQDRNAYIPKVDFLVDRTEAGLMTVDFFVSTAALDMVGEGTTTGSLLGTSVLETFPYDILLAPLESNQSRLWHPIYLQAEGECIQLRIYMSDEQLTDENKGSLEDFQLHAMNFFAQPTAARLQ